MPRPRIILRYLLFALLAAAVVFAAIYAIHRRGADQDANSRYATMHGWQQISGRWGEHNGVLSNSNYGRGDLLIAQHSQGANYTVAADIRFDLLFPETHYGDAGLVIRTTDPEQGVDSYQGYYAGIRPNDQTLILGRASYEWHELAARPLATPVSAGSWNRLSVLARGCMLSVLVTPLNGSSATRIDYQDPQCLTQGVAGLRSFYAQASWRNVKITNF